MWKVDQMNRLELAASELMDYSHKRRIKDRSKGKGRRFCLGDRIYSIPCRASYCARFEKKDELHQDFFRKKG